TSTTPAFTGTAEANSTVTIYSDGVQVASGTAAAYATPGLTAGALAAGPHSITAKATDVAGNISPTSGGLPLAVRTSISPTSLGTASNTTGTATLTLSPVTVATGNTIFATIAMDPQTSTVTVTDTAGNTYTKTADKTNGSGTTGVRTLVFSAPVTTALSAGTITVTFGATIPAAKSATFFSFNGLVSPSPQDKSMTATGKSLSPNSGPTATTSQPNELLIGAIGVENGAAITAGS